MNICISELDDNFSLKLVTIFKIIRSNISDKIFDSNIERAFLYMSMSERIFFLNELTDHFILKIF